MKYLSCEQDHQTDHCSAQAGKGNSGKDGAWGLFVIYHPHDISGPEQIFVSR
jgi:hypothetical protein